MKIAIAGDSAGEDLAKMLAEHLKDRHEVARSRAPTPVRTLSTPTSRTGSPAKSSLANTTAQSSSAGNVKAIDEVDAKYNAR